MDRVDAGGDGAVATAIPAPTGEGALDRRRMNLVFVTVLLGMLLAALDQTIVSTALPTIVGDLGGAGHLTWVVSSYLLADTIATVLAGKFGDLFGRKLVFQVSARDVRAGLGRLRARADMTWLIAWRAVQGFGAGGLHGHGDRADRRRHPAARARQVPGRAGCGVRGHDGARPAGRRPVHRPPVVAVGVLRQPARSASASSPWPRSTMPARRAATAAR